jgi:CheY-like chemotaxis protein
LVRLYFPAAAQQAETSNTGTMQTILLVEDEPGVLEMTTETLRSMGYDVVTAPDGRSALEILWREPKIDILFTHIVMPRGVNGIELAKLA